MVHPSPSALSMAISVFLLSRVFISLFVSFERKASSINEPMIRNEGPVMKSMCPLPARVSIISPIEIPLSSPMWRRLCRVALYDPVCLEGSG